MDIRTKKRHLLACRVMLHIFEGHQGVRKLGSIQALVCDGLVAAQALGMDAILHEQVAERTLIEAKLHEARVLAESLRIDRDAARAEAQRAKEPASVEVPCVQCGKPFRTAYRNAAYCSHECRLASRRAKAAARDAAKAPAKVVAPEPAVAEPKDQPSPTDWRATPAVCAHCGQTFRKIMPHQLYCSDRCGRAVRRERARARAAEQPKQAKRPEYKYHASVDYCPRLHVKALMGQIPCGMRPECWHGKPCKHVPQGAAKVSVDWIRPVRAEGS